MVKQKLLGLIIAALGILSVFPTSDGTAALMLVPLGIYIAGTKNKVIDVKEDK